MAGFGRETATCRLKPSGRGKRPLNRLGIVLDHFEQDFLPSLLIAGVLFVIPQLLPLRRRGSRRQTPALAGYRKR